MLIKQWLCSTILLISASTLAQVDKDVPDSTDLKMVGRYPGSYISAYSQSEFDSTVFPYTLNSMNNQDFESIRVEGERQVIVYDLQPSVETNSLKVFKSIVAKLQESGFSTKIDCSAEVNGCGYFFVREMYTKHEMSRYFSKFREFKNLHSGSLHIYSGSLRKDNNEYYIKVVVAQSKYSDFVQYSMDLLKVAKLKTLDLVLTSNKIIDGITTNGKVVLTGLYFDHNSTQLSDKSSTSLATISAYLKGHPKEKFLIVGHTDTQGGYDYNMELSTERAKAVSTILVTQYGIPASMLKFVGASYSSPIKSNTSDEGRSENRRVELVRVENF